MPAFITSTQHSSASPTAGRQEKEIKGIQTVNKEVKLSLQMFHKKQQDTESQYTKISCTFTHKKSEKKITKSTSFTIASKRIKCLEINLTKEMKGLYNENYKTLLKKIQDDINKWKHIPYS